LHKNTEVIPEDEAQQMNKSGKSKESQIMNLPHKSHASARQTVLFPRL
tara:strand:+ start:413 stop:556 length:144 start_codon:yes stop_codon:yes gene_type:complete